MAAARTYTTPSGTTVTVGRDAPGNHALTRSSDPRDFWLHAESFAGSHVVVNGSASTNDLAFAAALAVYFSKARTRGKTPVTVARIADVTTRKDGSATVAAARRVVGNPMICRADPANARVLF
jgi:predicted ribosome quality control (RQC) complex YloA/Tae2 family protein